MNTYSSLALQSTISSQGRFELKLEEIRIPSPAADEIVVQMEAAPINPADLLGMFGPVDKSSLVADGTPDNPILRGHVPESRLASVAARWDRPIFLGNEGAGTVVDAGGDARELVGRKVALRDGTYSLFRVLRAADCLLLPEGVPARDGAAACINPLTVLSMIETMRREGHKAIVHTAAASNVGQMLNRVCLEDNIGLVNIVRDARAAELLRAAGAKYVLDSTQEDFHNRLVDALVATGATIAFDAIGGGPLLSQILTAMEIGAEISLREMLNPEMVKRYTKTGTGEKFLVKMDG